MRGRCLRLLAACVLAGLAGPALAEAPVPTLLQPFEVVDTARRPLEPGQGLRVVLRFRADQAGKANELSRRLRKAIGADGQLVLGDVAYPVSKDKVEARHRQASFVIDHDTEVFTSVRAELEAKEGKTPDMAALTRFVGDFIQKKNLSRGLDVASVVAHRREGDCTEHAVLLTALARMRGIPARVVTGVALLPTPEGAQAFGHAWVEYAQKGRWQRADAALPESLGVAYLPLGLWEDEGPGYAFSSSAVSVFLYLQGIRIEAAAP
jgi:transglutaminase-like putative cysteine protease